MARSTSTGGAYLRIQFFLYFKYLQFTLFALPRAEKAKFEKYSEGVRSRPDIRFIPFAITEFGTLRGHATAFLTEMAKQEAASKGMHVGKLLASWRR
jgi:hypothetical protein